MHVASYQGSFIPDPNRPGWSRAIPLEEMSVLGISVDGAVPPGASLRVEVTLTGTSWFQIWVEEMNAAVDPTKMVLPEITKPGIYRVQVFSCAAARFVNNGIDITIFPYPGNSAGVPGTTLVEWSAMP